MIDFENYAPYPKWINKKEFLKRIKQEAVIFSNFGDKKLDSRIPDRYTLTNNERIKALLYSYFANGREIEIIFKKIRK